MSRHKNLFLHQILQLANKTELFYLYYAQTQYWKYTSKALLFFNLQINPFWKYFYVSCYQISTKNIVAIMYTFLS